MARGVAVKSPKVMSPMVLGRMLLGVVVGMVSLMLRAVVVMSVHTYTTRSACRVGRPVTVCVSSAGP